MNTLCIWLVQATLFLRDGDELRVCNSEKITRIVIAPTEESAREKMSAFHTRTYENGDLQTVRIDQISKAIV